MEYTHKVIAKIHTDFPEKFGVPRQSNLVEGLTGRIVFEKEYRTGAALKGLEGYDYIWVLWRFSGTERDNWSATVKPPRLGGNKRMGVFATRSPFRPNPIGLSSVKLLDIVETEEGPQLIVAGVDMVDGTEIFDIKPYLAYCDAHEGVRSGFGQEKLGDKLKVLFPDELLSIYPEDKRKDAIELLELDPRPSYQNDDRKYGVSFAGFDIHFTVEKDVLTVYEIVPL